MKLGQLKTSSKPITMVHPDHGVTDFIVVVRSPLSREHSNAMHTIVSNAKSDKSDIDWLVSQACALVEGWSGLEDEDGEIPFSLEKVIEIFSKPEYYWMVDQVLEVVSEKKGYMSLVKSRYANFAQSQDSYQPVRKAKKRASRRRTSKKN